MADWFVVNVRDALVEAPRVRSVVSLREQGDALRAARRQHPRAPAGRAELPLPLGEPPGRLPRPRRGVPAARRRRGAAASGVDFVHCPPGTEHVFVGAGDGPCAILMAGARGEDWQVHYPVSEFAARYGASVNEETSDPRQAYVGRLEPSRRERPSYWDHLPWAAR